MAFRNASFEGGETTLRVIFNRLMMSEACRLSPRSLPKSCAAANVERGHVWTVPAVQEEFDYQRSVRVRSCIRPHMMVSPSRADVG